MAEALAIEGAKWVASTIVTGLLKEGFSYLGVGISTKLQDLETTILPQFQLVIEAAERSTEHKTMFHLWLKKLKDAVYEAEDVLDLYKYQLLKEKVSDLNTRPALKPFKRVARKVNSKLSILSPQKIKLRRSLNKLEVIAAEAKTFRELLGIRIGNDGTVDENLRNEGQPKPTSSLPPHKVLGREKELDEIVDKYLLDQSKASEPEKSYSVVAIVGIGGAGKTTLAQLIYNDPRVAAHFDVKMWVCVSRTLDVFRHTREMIESASKNECPRLENPDVLQGELIKLINSKKLLLILDDVWYDNSKDERKWENLLTPLANAGKRGSKILVTTRTKNLPEALRPQNRMMLKDLETNVIVSLFMHHAFLDANLNNSDLQKELENIGMQIVQKLHGSPLAAKAVGRQLRKTLKVEAWKAALQQDNLRDSQQALLWSYQRLDAPLQRCFSYCSLFPKGYRYNALELIYLWMAEGFVNSSKDDRRIEDIAMGYFNELVSGSFLQDNKHYYNMHDLFHDLAENISKEDCLRIEDDQVREIPQTIRHLSIFGGGIRENTISLNKLENLHTLIIRAGSSSSDATADLLAATEKYKSLRVLMINYGTRKTLTKLLPNLKHLRFLSFDWSEEDELPAALGKLYHLQVLNAPYNCSLPRSMKNLINMRHLERNGALASLPYIGRLTSLQKLSKFIVKKEKGHDIGQLKNLNELRESLTISNLENVEGKDKVAEANLGAKSHLKQLHLKWDKDDDVERDLDMEVLKGLQLHPNLTELNIEGYKSPSWQLLEGCLPNKSDNCNITNTAFSRSLQGLTSLKSLELTNISTITTLPAEEVLRDLSALTTLVIGRFPWLKSLGGLFALPSLEELLIYSCPSLELEMVTPLPGEGGGGGRCILPPSLRRLWMTGITTMKSFVVAAGDLPNLAELWVKDCPSLASLSLSHQTALTRLVFGRLPWGRGGRCPPLESLSLSHLTALTSLPEGLPEFESLKELKLLNCPSISSLPQKLPESLGQIEIINCPVLEVRCRSPNGEDWRKIAHIPRRIIS